MDLIQDPHAAAIRATRFWTGVFAVLWLAGVSVGLQVHLRNEALEKQSAKLIGRFLIMQLQHQLQAPSEVICHDRKNDDELAMIRSKSFASHGATHFLPYAHVVLAASESTQMVNSNFETSMKNVRDASPERFWNNHLQKVCKDLAHDLRKGTDVGAHFRKHPDHFDQYVRPYLVRLLDAYDPGVGLFACEALLATGDRSAELQKIVETLARNGRIRTDVRRVMDEYRLSWHVPSTQDDSPEQWQDDWKQLHLVVADMKTAHPVTKGTIIRDWR